MKKENVSYSVMFIKKELRMIRLCNLQYEKTTICSTANMSFAVFRCTCYENPMEILQGMLCQKVLNPM